MNVVSPSALHLHPPSGPVDNLDLPLRIYDVVHIPFVQHLGLDSVDDVGAPRLILLPQDD